MSETPKTDGAKVDAVVRFEGQEFTLPADIAENDALIRNALSALYPDAATAEIHRTTENGRSTVSLLRKSVHKGRGGPTGQQAVLRSLARARESVNPAIALCYELQAREGRGELGIHERLLHRPAIDEAIAEAEQRAREVAASAVRLKSAAPTAATRVPVTF